MLSSVLRSSRAVQVNVAIMRTFVRIREMLATHEELRRKVDEMEKRYPPRNQSDFMQIRAPRSKAAKLDESNLNNSK